MLVRLLYASRIAAAVDAEGLSSIMRQAQANNPRCGVTGVLCASNGVFLQVLEGGRACISQLYRRIANDARHTDVELLDYEEICERRFAGWAMGRVDLSRLNPGLLLKYSATATLDPHTLPGRGSLALLEELVATASVAGHA